MAADRVVALLYRVIHDKGVTYAADAALQTDHEDFKITVRQGIARFELKYLFDEVRAAQKVVEPFIHLWAFNTSLDRGPGEFELIYDSAELEKSTPESSAAATREIVRGNYPAPPKEDGESDLAKLLRTYPRVRGAAGTVQLEARVSARSSGRASLSLATGKGEAASFIDEARGFPPAIGTGTVADIGTVPFVAQSFPNPPARSSSTHPAYSPTLVNPLLPIPPEHVSEVLHAEDSFDAVVIPGIWNSTGTNPLTVVERAERDLKKLREFAEEMSKVKAAYGRGHNHPPELIDFPEIDADLLAAAEAAVQVLRTQITRREPDPAQLALVERALSLGLKTTQQFFMWVIARGGTAAARYIDNIFNEASKAFGKSIGTPSGVAAWGVVICGLENGPTNDLKSLIEIVKAVMTALGHQ